MTRWPRCIALAIVGVLACAGAAHADAPSSMPLDWLISESKVGYQSWITQMLPYAAALYGFWATLQFAWSVGMALLSSDDVRAVFSAGIKQLVVTAFWWGLLTTAPEWMPAIPRALASIGHEVSSKSRLSPHALLHDAVNGFDIAWAAWLVSPGKIIIAFLTFVIFAMIAVLQALAILESHFVIAGGTVMLGFAGSSWTRHLAKAYIMHGLRVGVKLMVMELLMGLTYSTLTECAAQISSQDFFDQPKVFGSTVASLLLILGMAWTIPSKVAAMTTGSDGGGLDEAAQRGTSSVTAMLVGGALGAAGRSLLSGASAGAGSAGAGASATDQAMAAIHQDIAGGSSGGKSAAGGGGPGGASGVGGGGNSAPSPSEPLSGTPDDARGPVSRRGLGGASRSSGRSAPGVDQEEGEGDEDG